MLKLQFRDRRQKAVWLVDETFKIGSSQDNNLVINEAGIEPYHAEIINKNNAITLRNLGNGSLRVNAQSISTSHPLKAEDVIQLGDIELEIVDPQSQTYQGALGIQASAPATWKLVTSASWMTQQSFSIDKKVVIGRDPECDISIPVEHLSRRHAEIEVKGGKLHIKDLNSSNGTYVNGRKITEGFASPGDKIKVDVVTFEVEGPDNDPNKTIIRTAGTAEASNTATLASTKNQSVPKTSSGTRADKSKASNTSNLKRPLAADKTQEWIQNKPGQTRQQQPSYLGMAILGFVITIAVAAGLYFVL